MSWSGGLAEWQEGDTVYLSVAFTYKLDEAMRRVYLAHQNGFRAVVGGPALFLIQEHRLIHPISLFAEVRKDYRDAIAKHNPDATFASRGCPVGCTFCIVPKMEGEKFTLIYDFPVRPILCDNNLSALPIHFQEHIIRRYQQENVPLRDANSGFEPMTFTDEVYQRWKPLLNAGGGPWRFAYDETKEGPQVRRVMKMLRAEPQRRKRVYVLIGNEPVAACMERIAEVIDAGCEPHVQPYLDLNTMTREPRARFDWTVQQLKDVARWANGWLWKQMPFSEYDRSARKRPETYDIQQGLFV